MKIPKNIYVRKFAHGAYFYICLVHDGKKIRQATGLEASESNLPAVRAIRDNMIRAIAADRWDVFEKKAKVDKKATLAELFDEYQRISGRHGRPNSTTVAGNIGALRKMVEEIGGKESDSVDILTGRWVVKWAEFKLGTYTDEETAQISVNSQLRKARSLFTKRIKSEYAGKFLPKELGKFMEQFACYDPSREVARKKGAPAKSEVMRLKASADAMRGSGNPIWPVWILNYYLGLRAREIEFARWDWIEGDKLRVQWTKGIGGYRLITIPASVQSMIEELPHLGEYIVPGNSPTARYNITHRLYQSWIRGMGWNRKKASHDIRAYRINEWARERGPLVAKIWGGHVSLATTETNYMTSTGCDAPPIEED